MVLRRRIKKSMVKLAKKIFLCKLILLWYSRRKDRSIVGPPCSAAIDLPFSP
jgi:hypothetical protein